MMPGTYSYARTAGCASRQFVCYQLSPRSFRSGILSCIEAKTGLDRNLNYLECANFAFVWGLLYRRV